MPQLIAITTAGHYTDTQRSALKADIEQQMAGFDVHVLILPPGAQIQQGWVAPAVVTLVPAQPVVPVQTGTLNREVQHVDLDEPEPVGLPPHVWLYRNMLTDLQAVAPLGRDETNGQYAVAIDDLTDEQRAIPHIKSQLQGHDILCRDNLRYVDTADRAAQDRLDRMMRAQLKDLQKDNTSI